MVMFFMVSGTLNEIDDGSHGSHLSGLRFIIHDSEGLMTPREFNNTLCCVRHD